MARFDVYELAGSGPWVVDCQSDLLSHFNSRFVVPLLPEAQVPPAIPRLTPVFQIGEERRVMATHLAVSIPVRTIKRTIASLRDQDSRIIGALDTLISDA